ncbi:putative capsid protein [Avon-Heathcote Estuary associated circular virus 3]|uniref:Capsid protein n=1 Tax=Avon-Heathcote Estuary associated circular virus 3 TaxID=1618254 RepID=A0A0C5IBG8_9VIRU|nr:putative capsid protein [Avon-Heathcote Estuary associated circular virus 3]AJP36346.1 putative capsid protein [Avon-Heathcote Estuary associated circular virus 3]
MAGKRRRSFSGNVRSVTRVIPGPYTPRTTVGRRPATGFISGAASVARQLAPQFARIAAEAATQTAINYVTGGTQTKTKTKSKNKSSTGMNVRTSMSGGFFGNKQKKNIFQKYTTRGIVTTKETANILIGGPTDPDLPVFFGHATHANFLLIGRLFFRTVVKDVMRKSGMNVSSMSDTPQGGIFQLQWQIRDVDDAQSSGASVNTAGKTLEVIADELYADYLSFFRSTLNAMELAYISSAQFWTPSFGTLLAQIDLKDARIHILCKSDLKAQNRTLANGADDDNNTTENIENQPLYGKQYFGKGVGLVTRIGLNTTNASEGKSLICSQQTGLLSFAVKKTGTPGVNQEPWLREVPLPTLFCGKIAYGKVSIEPGQVKTSSLTHKASIKQQDFWNYLRENRSTAVKGGRPEKMGIFRIFCVEKMICCTAEDRAPQLGIELNQRIGLYVAYPRVKNTMEMYDGHEYT